MGLGKVFFSKALDALIIEGKEMVITCSNEKECNSLRVMIYRERDIYRRTIDPEINDKMAFTKCVIDGKPCIKIHRPEPKMTGVECFVVEGEELTPFKDTKNTQDINRLIEVMRQDGVSEEEIAKITQQ